MATEIALAIAVETSMVLIKQVINEVKRNQARLEEANSYVCTPILGINETRLRTTMNSAEMVTRNLAFPTEDRTNLTKAYNEAHGHLESIKTYLNEWLSLRRPHFLKMRRALSHLNKASRSFEAALKNFEGLTDGMVVRREPGAYLELQTSLFKLVPEYKWDLTHFKRRFVQQANLASNIRDVTKGDATVYVECKQSSIGSFEGAKDDLILLNQKLATADRLVGIPQVLGFRVEIHRSPKVDRVLQLVMSIPHITSEFESNTITSYMAKLDKVPSLNVRINLCAQLAEAVLHVHTMNLVHKDIRPSNILVIPHPPDQGIPGTMGSLYLVGWQAARRQQAATSKEGEKKWDRWIYQHPGRHGKKAKSKYEMEHDVYSLGVCMLEILQWKPLVREGPRREMVLSEIFSDTFFRLGLDKKGDPRTKFKYNEEWITQHRSVVEVLSAMVETEIPPVAGTRMADVVSECLNGTAIETEEEQELTLSPEEIAVSFVESILNAIRDVSASI